MKLPFAVTAKVNRVEPYGVYLDHEDSVVFVPASEHSWLPGDSPISDEDSGREVPVLLVRWIEPKREYFGSFRRIVTDQNPYIEIQNSNVEKQYHGVVSDIRPPVVFVRLQNRAVGIIQADAMPEDIKEGDSIVVSVESCDPLTLDVKLKFRARGEP